MLLFRRIMLSFYVLLTNIFLLGTFLFRTYYKMMICPQQKETSPLCLQPFHISQRNNFINDIIILMPILRKNTLYHFLKQHIFYSYKKMNKFGWMLKAENVVFNQMMYSNAFIGNLKGDISWTMCFPINQSVRLSFSLHEPWHPWMPISLPINYMNGIVFTIESHI